MVLLADIVKIITKPFSAKSKKTCQDHEKETESEEKTLNRIERRMKSIQN